MYFWRVKLSVESAYSAVDHTGWMDQGLREVCQRIKWCLKQNNAHNNYIKPNESKYMEHQQFSSQMTLFFQSPEKLHYSKYLEIWGVKLLFKVAFQHRDLILSNYEIMVPFPGLSRCLYSLVVIMKSLQFQHFPKYSNFC